MHLATLALTGKDVTFFGLTSLPGRQLLRILTAIVNGRYDDTVYLGNLPNTPQPATPSSNSLGPLPAVSRIRFVDSSLPALSYFPPHMTALLGDVDFRHGNLLSADFVRSCLADGPWDIVINVSAEKRPELAPAMYTQRTETQAQVIANAVMSAPGCNTQAFVQLSSGRVYPGREPDSPGSVETDEVDAEYMFPCRDLQKSGTAHGGAL
ncbi:hypothetical protein GQ42DRAFT_151968 [Ramicandelaber brevisporus]|nr:hypothetical protein GQ42DRAFT_151968 [Ramicandelaber brevisporus]